LRGIQGIFYTNGVSDMKQPAKYSLIALLLAGVAALLYPQLSRLDESGRHSPPTIEVQVRHGTGASQPGGSAIPTSIPPTALESTKTAAPGSVVGFTSSRAWQDHFDKHGAEFGTITAQEYLSRAQALRDAALSDSVVELVRSDGVITRFDKRSGDFIAFHRDRSIRTYFRPNDGESYFKRQAKR
jgi:hypothetical protein